MNTNNSAQSAAIRGDSQDGDPQDDANLASQVLDRRSRDDSRDDSIAGAKALESAKVEGVPAVVDVVETALASALSSASAAGQWSTVEIVARELGARRQARVDVIDLETERARRGRR